MSKHDLNQELEAFLPASKTWLLQRGYIRRTDAAGDVEYQWTEEGERWINQMPKAKASTR